jgi:hypothetical protein
MKTHTAWEVDGVSQLVAAADHAEAAVELVRSQPAPVGHVTRLVNVAVSRARDAGLDVQVLTYPEVP